MTGSPQRASTDITVLVVDNDPDLRATLQGVMADCGFHVVTASNGLQALHAVAEHKPSIVLLDMQMPVLDGVGFAQRLRESGQDIGIIVMSALPVTEEQMREIGAVAYIDKPFDLADLCSDIRRYSGDQAAS